MRIPDRKIGALIEPFKSGSCDCAPEPEVMIGLETEEAEHLSPPPPDRRPLTLWRSGLAACLVLLAVMAPAPAGLAHAQASSEVRSKGTGAATLFNGAAAIVPGGLTARAEGPSVILLSWRAPPVSESAFLTYRIEVREEGAGWSDLVPETGVRDTEYMHSGLPGGATYRYRVSAVGESGGAGPPSAVATATTPADTGEAAPGLYGVNGDASRVRAPPESSRSPRFAENLVPTPSPEGGSVRYASGNLSVDVSARVAAPVRAKTGFIRINPQFGYEILDPTTNINSKQRLILQRKKEGVLAPDSVHLHGAVTAVADYQSSNRENKFGYLMRHPTATNQAGTVVSEAAIHSAQLGFTGALGGWITANAGILYDPQQSFGKGTNTDLERNQLQLRRAWVLIGNLDRSPLYAGLGKMAIPFGLTDTVNPFSASSVWHAFGGLANGLKLGYSSGGLNLSFMGVQGGAQFRAANTPVNGTAVPSKLNNFAVDANYTIELGSRGTFLLGGSYLRGSAYCQDFPVVHFAPCNDNNPASGVYGKLVHGNLNIGGEFIRTLDEWPATFNPGIPEFPASKVTSFRVGAGYRYDSGRGPLDFSVELSRFVAGPDGAPWERQDQLVLGVAWLPRPGVKFFAEYIRVDGYTPLNFISGGNIEDENGEIMPDQTHSDASARSDVFLVGVTGAF